MAFIFGNESNHDTHEEQLFPTTVGGVQPAEDVGRLSVDVLETDEELILRSAIAGVRPEDLDVSVHNDMLTVRGRRHVDEVRDQARQLVRECHWGAFARSIILPSEVDAERIAATIKDGILTVRMPKVHRDKKISVRELP